MAIYYNDERTAALARFCRTESVTVLCGEPPRMALVDFGPLVLMSNGLLPNPYDCGPTSLPFHAADEAAHEFLNKVQFGERIESIPGTWKPLTPLAVEFAEYTKGTMLLSELDDYAMTWRCFTDGMTRVEIKANVIGY